jgi:hypothetical protein
MAREIKKGIAIDARSEEKITRELMARLEQPIEPPRYGGDLRLGSNKFGDPKPRQNAHPIMRMRM